MNPGERVRVRPSPVVVHPGGVVRLDDPQAEHPGFVTYTTAQGLASNSVSCITEDNLGRMYFGTARGLDRFDLETKHIRHYTRAEGLANNAVTVAFRDREGALWFGADAVSSNTQLRDCPARS